MSHPLENAVWGIIPIKNYRGVLVHKTEKGYCVFGETVATADEVDRKIDQANKSIQKSLNNEKE